MTTARMLGEMTMARILALSDEQFALYLLALYLHGDPALMKIIGDDEEEPAS